ncbi:MAG: hypothetical protein M3443_06885 [Actinomycetota bacterium]|nr:hypothetical protein [Actinomycetota bacterium]
MTSSDTESTKDSSVVADDVTPARPGPNPFVLGALALLVVAAGLAAWFGVAWLRADGDDDLKVARTRDEVTRVGEQAIITFSTLNYRSYDKDIEAWVNASTGPLRDEVDGRRAVHKAAIEKAKTVATGKVLKSAVADLNEHDGKAVIVATIQIEVTPDGQRPKPKFERVQAALERTETGWKLSQFGYLPYTPAA